MSIDYLDLSKEHVCIQINKELEQIIVWYFAKMNPMLKH